MAGGGGVLMRITRKARLAKVEDEEFSPRAKEKSGQTNGSGARLFRLEEVKFFCTFELFSQGLPLPPTQETNTETGLLQ